MEVSSGVEEAAVDPHYRRPRPGRRGEDRETAMKLPGSPRTTRASSSSASRSRRLRASIRSPCCRAASTPRPSSRASRVIAHSGDLSPQMMTVAVTRPLEEAAREVLGVRRVRSKTIRGATEISVLFNPDTDMQQALQLMQGKVDEARPGAARRNRDRRRADDADRLPDPQLQPHGPASGGRSRRHRPVRSAPAALAHSRRRPRRRRGQRRARDLRHRRPREVERRQAHPRQVEPRCATATRWRRSAACRGTTASSSCSPRPSSRASTM